MTEKLKQTIEEEVEKLPKEIQEVIKSSDWVNLTEEIGREYLLDEIQLNNFQLETLLVLVNLTDIRFLAINIENQAGVTKGDASAIATETSQKIFTPIYNILSENVKKALKNKKTNWEQNLGFVLSGGDYSAFITPTSPQSSPERRGGSPFPFQGKAGDEVTSLPQFLSIGRRLGTGPCWRPGGGLRGTRSFCWRWPSEYGWRLHGRKCRNGIGRCCRSHAGRSGACCFRRRIPRYVPRASCRGVYRQPPPLLCRPERACSWC